MYCNQCGRELPECDENEPYPWIVVEGYVYCLKCTSA